MVLVIFWILFTLSALFHVKWAILGFFVSLVFGSFAILPPALTGGTTFLPITAFSFLLSIKALLANGNTAVLSDGMLNPQRLGLLTAFLLISILVTLTSPLLFPDAIVMGLNSGELTNLRFTSGNITQPLYLLASYLVTASLFLCCLDEVGRRAVYVGILTGGVIAVCAGTCDLATAGTSILAPLRTATYALMVEDQVAGMKRVVGFNTEASAYGSLTLSFAAMIYFMRLGRVLGGPWAKLELPLVLALLTFTVLSTSSAAYLGLIVFVLLAACANLIMRFSKEDSSRANLEILVVGFVALVAIGVVILKPDLLSPATNMIDGILFKKTQSSSFEERSTWNAISFGGFLQTYGYGVGVGSTRASSWPVALLSSCGSLAAVLMIAFFFLIYTLKVPSTAIAERGVVVGARFAILVSAVPTLVAATLPDFGPYNAALFAIAAALPMAAAPPRWLQALRDKPGQGAPSTQDIDRLELDLRRSDWRTN